ncbi:MAG: hypothetical protein EWV75_21770 [Microcystis wesenbergii Mw_QC_S_20081001_S30D]|jgi:FKBP-type peptidyl-prolyl cis-trans isomerase (trigger factor)|uniref:Uncharacterized protein n=1 Tax=Microcystis wesenbergii Mw_QC_S_20081001_S30D TaxID=2486245 RepID=A0A552J8G1_9CHRO|nr:hypothetical protein [Microcystis aeruginosa W11-03]NCR93440.1 hypothetical protein [Microcystis aeruginosa W11-06]TRU91941.1 MAG: hypothetical protein EWV75_21770 [Microcystis wesenbergii Mw_QC_S_20081001_S30D]TRV01773.1 MAG: hypothetical protein EWV74_10205 [Microcystis wesenbergii Mw_QC_S_20081001_S30]TRV03853.1 MAG: hypothetical protein EWV73_04210 [Microcystis wesenbergii Mw_QC_B_20070930_S4D]TRV18139.1 MAG: hypothetical protein EWV89_00625 [Microcystis wesenbergii Mw_QC_B_20070930_S4]
MDINAKIKELAQKYEIPPQLLEDAMALEAEKTTLKNRQLSPKIVQLIEKYTDSSPSPHL